MDRMTSWITRLAATVALTLTAATAVSAQVCAGYPTLAGQAALGARIAFPDGETQIGVEGNYNMAGPPAFFANVSLANPDAEDAADYTILGVGAAYELTGLVEGLPAALSVCPLASVNASSIDDETYFLIPLGIGIGTTLTLENGPTLMPFVIPQFVLARASLDDFDASEDFGIGGGVVARFGALYAGASFGRVFSEGAKVEFVVRGGLTFGTAQLR